MWVIRSPAASTPVFPYDIFRNLKICRLGKHERVSETTYCKLRDDGSSVVKDSYERCVGMYRGCAQRTLNEAV